MDGYDLSCKSLKDHVAARTCMMRWFLTELLKHPNGTDLGEKRLWFKSLKTKTINSQRASKGSIID